MGEMVRAALVQAQWAGDKDLMTKNAIRSVQQAAAEGARVVCLQELFNGPYFCQVQDGAWYDWAEPVPDGPTIRQFMDVARENGTVLVVPVYELESSGVFYNTAAVIDADGRYLGKHRKNHIPQVAGFWEKFYFRPGNLGYPVFDTAVGRIGVYICYERHFPEGWRALGLAGAKIVFNPSATSRGMSEYLWRLEQPSAAVANEYFVGTINRVGVEPLGANEFYGQSYFVDPRGQFVGEVASDVDDAVVVRDLDLGLIDEVRRIWAFYRDRRPETYDKLCEA
jgi:N-carbamoylputrescine amidase